ncbi:hypothetical protein [Streptomyces sp. RLA2-12]|uniref:hypothetical protein n=1 Tax=Streptomyces sp. RLA2-12 TaxID=2721242 RepID=UPI00145F6A71|nr:hypothetical protein [Streptomyces sp. RLA2-12]NMI63138.1 hypothetical protein [Streptomyces sp. RLA2-12]
MNVTASDFTAERITALVATFVGVLISVLTMKAGAGIGNVVGAGFLAYVFTIGGIAWKIPLQLGRVITATGKGALSTAVITVIVLIGIAKAFKGLA